MILDESVDDKCNLEAESDDEFDKDLNSTLQSEISKINESLGYIATLMQKKKDNEERKAKDRRTETVDASSTLNYDVSVDLKGKSGLR